MRRALAPPPTRPQRRVVVTGLGLVTPLGCGVAVAWPRVLAGQCAVRALGDAFSALPARVAAAVPRGAGAGEFQAQHHVDRANARAQGVDFVAFALAAAHEALHDSGLACGAPAGAGGVSALPALLGPYSRERVGVAIGSGVGCISDVGAAALLLSGDPTARRLSPFFVPRILTNMAAGHVSIRWGLRGPNHAVATACATGAHSIGDAFRCVDREQGRRARRALEQPHRLSPLPPQERRPLPTHAPPAGLSSTGPRTRWWQAGRRRASTRWLWQVS